MLFQQHEQCFCYMKNLLISSGNVDKLDFLKFHLHSFPGNVPDDIEQFLKDKTIPLKVLSLAQLHAYIIQV